MKIESHIRRKNDAVRRSGALMGAVLSIFLIMSGGWMTGAAAAQTTVKLEPVVVTATRSERPADEVTADVAIIDAETIRSAPANNVDDILRRLGGVDIRRPSDVGITSPIDINIRGVGGTKRVLFMVDGVPTNSALTGFIYPNQVQLGAIEQMEVVKGPFSSLYGSNAMGGVINFITRMRREDGIEVTPMIKYGSYDLFETGAGVLGRKGRLAFNLNAGWRQIDNHYRRNQDVEYRYDRGRGVFIKNYRNVSDHAAYSDHRLFSRVLWEMSERTQLIFSGNYAGATSEMGYTTFLDDPRSKDSDHTFYFLNLNARTALARGIDLDVRVFTNYDATDSRTEHILRNPAMGNGNGRPGEMPGGMQNPMPDPMPGGMPGPGPYTFLYGKRENHGRNTGVQIKSGLPLGDFNYLTAGIDANYLQGVWKNLSEDGTRIGPEMDESLTNQALYLQNETDLAGRAQVTLGLRYDINSQSDNALSPKIGLRYRLSDRIRLRSSIGRAFRAPNLNELYTPTWMMVPGIPFESNPDLKPETIWSYDLGAEVHLTDQLEFYVTGFYSKAKDLISNPIVDGVMRYANLDEVETSGFETGFNGNIFTWLSFYLNYTYTHAVERATGRLDNQPLHQAGGGLMVSHAITSQARLTGTLDLRYNGEMAFRDRMTRTTIDLDDWLVADAGMRLELFKSLGIQAAVTNVLNTDYEIHGSNLGPQRSYWLAVDYRF